MIKENVNEIDTIMNITNHIVEAVNPLKVILFGSFARGEETKNSDYDLCILANDTDKDDFKNQWMKARKSFRGFIDRDVDMVFNTPIKYNKNKDCRACVSYYIDKEGVVLYESIDKKPPR